MEQSKFAERTKYELKYEACLDALEAVDAHLSQAFQHLPQLVIRQEMTTEQLRKIHNKMILTVDNPRIVELFLRIVLPTPEDREVPPTDMLNNFRDLVRIELGFGEITSLDRNKAWFGAASADPHFEITKQKKRLTNSMKPDGEK